MKSKIRKFSKCMLWVFACLLLLVIRGCGPTQSKEVVYVTGFKGVLFYNESHPEGEYLDRWAVSSDAEGKDICGIYYGVLIQLTEDGEEYHQAGIRVDIRVDAHGSIAGYGDIWDEEAPNGEEYGNIVVSPKKGSGEYDGVVYGRTTGEGALLVFWGLGDPEGSFDPDAPLDYGWQLPGPGGGYDDVFDTWVQLKITVPRIQNPMPAVYVWGTFNRMQWQNMWATGGEPPGVYHVSFSGLGKFGGYSMSMQQLGSIPVIELRVPISEIPDEFKVEKTPKTKASDYPFDTEIHKAQKEAIVTMDAGSSEGPSLDWAHWYQLRWDSYAGEWYWDDPPKMHALWFAYPNDPNNIIDTMTSCEPYALWADVNLPEPFDGNDAKSTVVLRSIDKTTGEVFSKMPMYVYLAGKSPDNKILTMFSDYVVIVENPEDEGYYLDIWENVYVAIYAPEGSVLDADFPERFGDFNADDEVDYLDLALFVEHWLDSANDVNTTYDAMYEEPNNWSGSIDFRDFSAFARNWQPAWTQGMMMGSGMDSGSSLDSGFTEGLYTSAPAEQQQFQVAEPDIEELINWLEQLWLSGELNGYMTEDEYLEFRKAIEESF